MAERPEGQPRPEEELQGEQVYRIERRLTGRTPSGATIHEIVTHAPLVEQAHAKLEESVSPEDKLAAREALDSALLRTFDEVDRQLRDACQDLANGRGEAWSTMYTLEYDAEGLVDELSDKKVQEFVSEIVDGKKDELCLRYLKGGQILRLPDEDFTKLVEFLGRDEKTRGLNFISLISKTGMAGAKRVEAIMDRLYPESLAPDERPEDRRQVVEPEEEEAGIPEDMDDDVEVIEVRQQELDKNKGDILKNTFGDEEAKAVIEQMRQKRERQFFSVVKRWNKAHHDLRINKVPRNLQERDVPIERLAKELQKFIGEQQGELALRRAEKLLVSFIEREKAMRKEGPVAAAA